MMKEGLKLKGSWEIRLIDKKTGRVIVKINPKYFRPTEVDILIGDYTKAREILDWKPTVKFEKLVELMMKNDL